MEAALDLLRRLPPSEAVANAAVLRELLPPGSSAPVLAASDQPLAVKFDEGAHREFVACEYNRDGDSHRSPWSNTYVPPLGGGGVLPDETLRELEVQANEVFNEYRRMYYGGGTSSVYLWSQGPGFAGCFAVKKEVEGEGLACWDAIHLVTVEPRGSEFAYRLSSTLLLSASAAMRRYGRGAFSLDGVLHRTAEEDCALGEGHIANIGGMIERTETNVRNMLGEVYFGKTRDVVHVLREPEEQIRHRGM
eukprot:jgi/Tetstr1/427464/TSEL_001763.t1